MNDRTPSDDWTAGMRDGCMKDVARLGASGELTVQATDWLTSTLLAEHHEVYVHRLLIAAADAPLADLAGYFAVIGPLPGMNHFLYSPVAGLLAFSSWQALHRALEQRLADAEQCEDVLRFVPVEVREGLGAGGTLRLEREPINGNVFVDRRQSVLDLRLHNLEALNRCLIKLPSLHDTPAEHLKVAIEAYWSTDVAGLSLRERCVQAVGDRFFNALLQARHAGVVSPEQFSEFKAFPRLNTRVAGHWRERWQPARLLLLEFGTAQIELTGLFNTYLPASTGEVFLFGNRGGLEKFANRSQLRDALLSGLKDTQKEKVLMSHVALEEQAELRVMREVIVEVELIGSGMFETLVQSILIKQLRDTVYLMGKVSAQGVGFRAAVDHGLDIRNLLDPQLMTLDTHGRWTTGFVLDPPPEPAPRLQHPLGASEVRLLHNKLQALQAQITQLLQPIPSLFGFADERLAVQLAAAGKGHLKPQDLVVQTYSSYSLRKSPEPLTSRPLNERLLERLTGCDALPREAAYVRVSAQRNSPQLKPVDSLDGAALLPMLDRAAEDFLADFSQQLQVFFGVNQASQNVLSRSRRLAQLRGTTLRYALQLKRLDPLFSVGDVGVISALLDQPKRSHRATLNGFVPDASELSFRLDGFTDVIRLSQCVVMTERGGTDPQNSGRAILWTLQNGFERFSGIEACLDTLSERLYNPIRRWELLECIDRRVHPALLAHLQHEGVASTRFVLSVINTHWLENSQNLAIEQQVRDVQYAFEQAVLSHKSAQGTVNHVQTHSVHTGLNLEGLQEQARSWLFAQSLPGWLVHASHADQQEYANVLWRYQQVLDTGESYLDGVPELLVYARERLTERLALDFPGQALDPDQIEISVVEFTGPAGGEIAGQAAVSRVTHPLTWFSLSNFFNLESGIRSYRSLNNRLLPAGFDDRYVRDMLRKLDTSAGYQSLLEEKLSPGKEGAAHRQQLFCQQLPAQVLQQALEAKLTGTLSDTAYHYVKQIFTCPDGMARESLGEPAVVVRPLELLAIAGRHPDTVQGTYLIGPAAPSGGPLIVYTLYNKDYVLKEYADEQALLEDLYRSAALQTYVLARLEARVRKVYDHGGFIEPHIGYIDPTLMSSLQANPPVTLATRAVTGNVLHTLYRDTVQLRLQQARDQSKTVAQADWASLKHLLSLIADIVLLVLPGKLALPLVVWQSEQYLKAAVESGAEGHWGATLSEFATALLLLSAAYTALKPVRKTPPAPMMGHVEPMALASARLSDEQQRSLRPFEVNDIALNALSEDTQTGIFSDPASAYFYVPLGGKVFRLVTWRDRWRVYIGPDRQGPLVKRNQRQLWELDLKEPLLGGGPMISKPVNVVVTALFQRSLNISAFGMRKIQRLFPVKAQFIREAHEHAVDYLSDCQAHLQSVNSVSELSAPTQAFLQQFFSVERIGSVLLEKLKKVSERVLSLMQHPKYSPVDSNRYAICELPDTDTLAIAGIYDVQRPIYLNSSFFEHRHTHLAPIIRTEEGRAFDTDKHRGAAALIHEFTHLALDTFDINYVGSTFPFPEVLVEDNGVITELKSALRTYRDQQLSLSIGQQALFKPLDARTSTLGDMLPFAQSELLKRTGTKTLGEAQALFVNDPNARADIILMNADSVTVLLTWLGYFKPRETWVV